MAGAISKVIIGTYKDSTYGRTISTNAFTALINPTGFSFTRKNDYDKLQPIGAVDGEQKFSKAGLPSLQLEFLFDGTGVTEENTGIKLINAIKRKSFEKKQLAINYMNFMKQPGHMMAQFINRIMSSSFGANLNLKGFSRNLQLIISYLKMTELL
uniref:Contractile injection system tube protein N-terminal domain-containing protein n=1 Tax=Chryseobacterium endophyticum TaxID=1854762 RepID=A0AAU6WNQ3_9FLAO